MEGSEGKEQERILIPVANPETIEGIGRHGFDDEAS